MTRPREPVTPFISQIFGPSAIGMADPSARLVPTRRPGPRRIVLSRAGRLRGGIEAGVLYRMPSE